MDPLVVAIGGRVALTGPAGALLEAHPESDPLAGIGGALQGAHLRVASLDGPLGGATPAAGEARARALSRGNIDVLVSRNGGPKAALDKAGIGTAAGSDGKPYELNVQGWTIAVVSAGIEGDKAQATLSALGGAIEQAKKSGAVVLVLDDGTRVGGDDRPASPTLATRALSAGADAVLGVGARVPMGVSWVSGRAALHGLGSLVADDDPKDPWTARGVFARLRFFRDGRREVALCPYRLVTGLPQLLAGPSRPTEEGIFSRTLLRLSDAQGGLNLSEPDLHSCMRLSPRGASRKDGG